MKVIRESDIKGIVIRKIGFFILKKSKRLWRKEEDKIKNVERNEWLIIKFMFSENIN